MAKNILIVDDNVTLRENLKELLRVAGGGIIFSNTL